MHGEYKVPGGKLVVVDLDVDGGVITQARLAGDFFLEPDDALEDINHALEGLSTGASHDDIEKAVTTALPDDVVMLGFSADAVATVVRRALTSARDFTDYTW